MNENDVTVEAENREQELSVMQGEGGVSVWDSLSSEELSGGGASLISVECICMDKEECKEEYVKVPVSVRLRNWPVWLAVLGSVGIILNSLGVFARLGLDNDAWNAIVNALGAIFIALGVVNNPTDPKHF